MQCFAIKYIVFLDILVDVNGQEMKPLEEYMLFTKTGSEKVQVTNSQGIRTAQCAVFDVVNKPRPGLSLNISLVGGLLKLIFCF